MTQNPHQNKTKPNQPNKKTQPNFIDYASNASAS